MAAKTGASTNIGLKIGSTFGTAAAAGAGDKLVVESIDDKANVEVLNSNSIGSGADMMDEADTGVSKPSFTFEQQMRYNDAGTALEALLFGASSSITMGSGAYCHSILWEATRNQRWATLAREYTGGSVVEYASCTPTKLSVKATPGAYMTASFEGLADAQSISSSTNTAATLATTTVADSKKIICKLSDTFRIKPQAGAAFNSGDVFAITSAQIDIAVPAELVPEIKGSAGNGQSRLTGQPPFEVTLTVTFKNESEDRWRTAFNAGTEYKADLTIVGDLIGGSQYYTKQYNFPRLRILEEPSAPLASSAENPLTVVFKALYASSNPTGMISRFPYERIINTKATNYLA